MEPLKKPLIPGIYVGQSNGVVATVFTDGGG